MQIIPFRNGLVTNGKITRHATEYRSPDVWVVQVHARESLYGILSGHSQLKNSPSFQSNEYE